MMRIVSMTAVSFLCAVAVFGQTPSIIILANEDHESGPVGGLPFPPYNAEAYQWDNSACCDGAWSIMTSNVRAWAGSNSLASINQIVSNGVGASVDAQIRIPVEYRPLSSATFRLWRYVSHVVSSGVVTMTISGDPDVGLLWTNDGTVWARLAANDNRAIWWQEPGTWTKWQIDYDFVNKTVQIRVFDDPIASFQLAPSVLNNPWTFILGSNIGGSGQANNQFFDDNVYAAITPLCDPSDGDCNANGLADRCDLDPDQGGNSQDCNSNVIPDECDIASGFSADMNSNGIPDECDIIIVNSLADPGVPDAGLTTLREAITTANAGGGITITFDPALAGGTIQPTSQLPAITGGNITINGDIDGDCIPDIVLDGALAGGAHGLVLESPGNRLRGLIVNQFVWTGITVHGSPATGNVIECCYVGTGLAGATDQGNDREGIFVLDGASGNTIGPGNVVSGNGLSGVLLEGNATSGNVIRGNRIGTDRGATFAIANGEQGVVLRFGANHNTVGPANIISGNGGGVLVATPGTDDNVILGNFVGTNHDGTSAVANSGHGVFIFAGPQHNRIGGPAPEDANIISGNGLSGIVIGEGAGSAIPTAFNQVIGNLLGVGADGITPLPNGGDGVTVVSGPIPARDNQIGPGNVISGNSSFGVFILGVGASGNCVYENMIGTNRDGDFGVPNGGAGVFIDGSADNNTIGPGNLISGNSGLGIGIISSNDIQIVANQIGTDISGLLIVPNTASGILVNASARTMMSDNLISGNGDAGIGIIGSSEESTIIGNKIGVDSTGNTQLGNFANGITISNGPTGTRIGGAATFERNIISGNGATAPFAHGIVISGSFASEILNNFVGTNATGTIALPNNGQGIVLENGAMGNTIGPGNVVSGNALDGISISGAMVQNNVITENLVGTDITGSIAIPNAGVGINIQSGASQNIIGPQNLISGHSSDGIRIEGVDTVGITVSGNSITANGSEGIDLIGAANMDVQPPNLLAKVGDSLFGTSDAADGSVIEVFSDPEDEGQWLIGSTTLVDGSFVLTTPSLDEADNITATVTDLAGNTSEFSAPLACFGSPGDPDSDGDGVPDQCDISEDCNGNGILDLDEIAGAGGATVFATGIGVPEEILASSGDYPPGFFVTGLTDGTVYNVSSLGGTVTTFATGFTWPIAATMAPHEFGNEGERMFVADLSESEVLVVSPSGTVTPFADLGVSDVANGLVYIPQALGGIAGGKLLVTSYLDSVGFALGSIFAVDPDGLVTPLIESVGAALWTPTLAPDDFGDYANHVFVGEARGPHLYAFNLTTLALELFANVPMPEGQTPGLRQMAFSPIGWAASFDPTLANERVLLVSVASECCQPSSGDSVVSVWDQRGTHVATLSRGPDGLPFEARGLLFVKNDLLVSDLANHNWLFRVTADDFGLSDCDDNGILDECQLADGSADCNQDAVLDNCQVDCNGNGIPDQCDLVEGSSQDCDGNQIPDSCDSRPDCNGNGLPDSCDLENGMSLDCNGNGQPDECELVSGFATILSENTTGFPDPFFTATPDGENRGLAGQMVTFDFGTGRLVIDLPGSDFSVYEGGGPEYESIDVLVSVDGVDFVSVKLSEAPLVRIPGDEAYTNDASGRSYDLSVVGLDAVRFIRIDGVGDGIPVENFEGFDLDAIGAIHLEGDCDENGMPDVCQDNDFDGDGEIDSCDLDIDNDGILNDLDDCDFTPQGVPTDQHGRPRGDWDGDCAVTLADYSLLATCLPLSGPNAMPPFSECLTVFDSDGDNDVDLMDLAVFQLTFGIGQ